MVEAIVAALAVDPSRLLGERVPTASRIHAQLPDLSHVLATCEQPDPGPLRPHAQLQAAAAGLTSWRLSAQHLRIATDAPLLLPELHRALATQQQAETERQRAAGLLVAAYRAADAVAFTYGAYDLSARLIGLRHGAARHRPRLADRRTRRLRQPGNLCRRPRTRPGAERFPTGPGRSPCPLLARTGNTRCTRGSSPARRRPGRPRRPGTRRHQPPEGRPRLRRHPP